MSFLDEEQLAMKLPLLISVRGIRIETGIGCAIKATYVTQTGEDILWCTCLLLFTQDELTITEGVGKKTSLHEAHLFIG